jgi:hypothetical protein
MLGRNGAIHPSRSKMPASSAEIEGSSWRKRAKVQKQVTQEGWLGSMPEGRRPQIRGFRAGGSLAVASLTPATQLLSPAKMMKLNHAGKKQSELTQSREGEKIHASMEPSSENLWRVGEFYGRPGNKLLDTSHTLHGKSAGMSDSGPSRCPCKLGSCMVERAGLEPWRGPNKAVWAAWIRFR